MKLSISERVCISKLFNKNGYVLDFSTAKFDAFTEECIGIRLTEKYRCSKGEALEKYLATDDASSVIVLVEKLLEYAIASDSLFELLNYNAIIACRKIIKKYKNGASLPSLSASFSSEYIEQMAQLMNATIETNPTEAIGKAKELIESCCKTILDNLGVKYKHNIEISPLIETTVKQLKLTPNDISDSAKEAEAIKSLLGNLRAIATNMATLRNAYGSGHGKSASYKGLAARHARLAVGSSITLVNFLWETYESQSQNVSKKIME